MLTKNEIIKIMTNGDLVTLANYILENQNTVYDEKGNTALHYAVANNAKAEIIELLITLGCRVDLQNKDGLSPFELAMNNSNEQALNIMMDILTSQPQQSEIKRSEDKKRLSPENELRTRRELYKAAVGKQDWEKVVQYLNEGVDVNLSIDDEANTALHYAVINKNDKMITLLLSKKADPQIKNNKGLNPIEIAVQNSFQKCVAAFKPYINDLKARYIKAIEACKAQSKKAPELESLLKSLPVFFEQGVPVNTIIDNFENTGLHWAILHKIPKLVELLLIYGSDITCKNIVNKTAVDLALYLNEYDCIKIMLNNCILDDETATKCKTTLYKLALQKLAHQKQLIIDIQTLLANGFPADTPIDENGNTALHLAIAKDDFELVKILLSYKASLTQQNLKGFSPLQVVVEKKDRKLIQFILDNAWLNDNEGIQCQNALYVLSYKECNAKEIGNFFANGVSPNLTIDEQKNTGLHLAVESKDLNLIQLFLLHNANVDLKNKKGLTPLDLALTQDSWPCINLMINHINQINADLSSLYYLWPKALEAKQLDTVTALLKSKAIYFFNTDEGKTYFQQLMQKPEYQNLIIFLFEQDKSRVIQDLVFEKGTLPESITDVFNDEVITMEVVKNPYIVPQGSTYDEETIKKLTQDPQTRDPLVPENIIPNKKIRELLAYFKIPKIDIDKLPPGLICPETGEIYNDPMVTADGETYEKKWIEDYLIHHNEKTPHGTAQKIKELYPNRMFKDLIAKKYAILTKNINQEKKSSKEELVDMDVDNSFGLNR